MAELSDDEKASVSHRARASEKLRPAIEAYMADHDGGCPPALSALPEQYARFKEPPTDAWGHQLRLICPADTLGKSYVLESGGPDGEPGGLDRIQ